MCPSIPAPVSSLGTRLPPLLLPYNREPLLLPPASPYLTPSVSPARLLPSPPVFHLLVRKPLFLFLHRGPSCILTLGTWLKCSRCDKKAKIAQLFNEMYCPQCSNNGPNGRGGTGRPFMTCSVCGKMRVTNKNECRRSSCQLTFL